ncbi:MAG: IS982 family transposase [Sulfuricurvum sp.]
MTIGYLAISDFNGNYCKAHHYLNTSGWFKSIDYSRFIRRINSLQESIEDIFENLSALFMKVSPTQIYAIDSFPVELCQIQREKRSNLLNDPELKGYNASKKRYFYGFKVHMITTTDKEPVQCCISMGREADVTIAYELIPQFPDGSIGIGDKGYVSKELETISAEHGVHFKPIYRQNQGIEDRILHETQTQKKDRNSLFDDYSQIWKSHKSNFDQWISHQVEAFYCSLLN